MTPFPAPRRLVSRIVRGIAPSWEGVLFSFAGGTGAWPAMGRDLYRHEPAFRASVDDACGEVEAVLGWSPAGHFRGEEDAEPSPELRRRNEIIRLAVLQIAQVDLWRREGIEPAGVLSVSLGEMIAPYAAGALSRRDCARVAAVVSHAISRTRTPERMFLLREDTAEAARMCRTAPAPLDLLGSTHAGSSMVLCREADADLIRGHLGARIERETATEWSYHTPRLDVDRAWMRHELRGVRALPPRCPVYSAAAGGELRGGAPFDARFFAWMVSRPFHFAAAVSAALADGFGTVVTLGAHPATRASLEAGARARGVSIRFIDSMRIGDERGAWRRARAGTRALRVKPRAPEPPASARTVDMESPSVRARIFDVYEELRRGGGAQRMERHGYWLVLGHADVLGALARPECFSSRVPSVERTDAVLLGSDPPDHTVIRRSLTRHFSAGEVARRTELAEHAAEELLRPLRDGRAFDVVSELARPLVHRTGADVLGVETAATASLVEPTFAADGGTLQLYAALEGPLSRLAERSAAFAWLRAADGAGLDDEAARSLLRLLWIAGTDTLGRVLPLAVLLLLQNDGLRARIALDGRLAERFVDEVLRLRPPEHVVVRVATRDVEVGGATIPAGAMVRLSLAAANRDPARFDDPASIRLDRPPGAHLAFGGGVHRCIGAAQARAQLSAVLRVLLRVAPGLRNVQPLETIRYLPGAPLSTIEQLVIER
jgi:cytochrome P450